MNNKEVAEMLLQMDKEIKEWFDNYGEWLKNEYPMAYNDLKELLR